MYTQRIHISFKGLLLALSLALTVTACGSDSDRDEQANSGTGGTGGSGGTGGGAPAQIKVLSNRADLISGGDALVEVIWPTNQTPANAKVTLNGQDITGTFAQRENGRYMGLVTGLDVGSNQLVAQATGVTQTSYAITNYPNGGPIFSGPQVQPWVCQSGALDAQCNQPAEYSYLYKSTNRTRTGLLPYDPQNPPTDVASTTTDDGITLPFIVRVERGFQDRDEYKILTLFQPDQPWTAWSPQPQWNRKLLITHGGNCGADHAVGSARLDDYAGTIPANPLLEQSYIVALGRGFAVASTALNNNGHNCNISVQAESMMMAKERLVEQYGELRYTIGTGCSGGSLVQQQVSNAYPGIYQGLLLMCSYPDTFSAGTQFADSHLMRKYFEDPSRWSVPWTPQQFADVEGHISHVNAVAADEGLFKAATDPTNPCKGVSDAERYHPETNPAGVRCGVLDYLINIFGPRAPSVWSPAEVQANRGFAGNPIDNVGIQYGLNALRQGRITPEHFVDLNVKIGGLTIDIKRKNERTVADQPALANAYRSGLINQTNNLNKVAMINFTGPDPGIAHDTVHAFWTRWRLDREHGNHDTHVMWGGPAPLIGDPNYVYQGLTAMDRWLAAIEQDTRSASLTQKIVDNKPADVHDQCSDGAGHKVLDQLCPEQLLMVFGTPREVAGDHKEADTMKCQLKPLNRSDNYGPIPFTDAQWDRLKMAFPDGVCDYSKPAVDRQGASSWLTYQNAAGEVIYGGIPLPAPPANSGSGMVSPAFLAQP